MFRSSFQNRQKHAKRGKRFSIREHAADADSFSIKYNLILYSFYKAIFMGFDRSP